jgi:hypothetical protein
MVDITNRFRKILRTVLRGVGVSVVSLILQACYGVMYPDDIGKGNGPSGAYGMPPPETTTSIYGRVTAKNTGDPIFGIQVSVEETEYNKRTDENGWFSFFGIPIQEIYKLKFEDVDGPANGGLFKEQTWTLKESGTHSNLLVAMDIAPETDEE